MNFVLLSDIKFVLKKVFLSLLCFNDVALEKSSSTKIIDIASGGGLVRLGLKLKEKNQKLKIILTD